MTMTMTMNRNHEPVNEELKRKYGLLSVDDLKSAAGTAPTSYLVDGFLPQQSLTIAVGDSGIGKSPFFFQMAMCIAHGLPFLGRVTTPGRVLYLDFENGIHDANVLGKQLTNYLSIEQQNDRFLTWNINQSEFPA